MLIDSNLEEASSIINEASDEDERKGSICDRDSSDEFWTGLTEPDENSSFSTERHQLNESDFNSSHEEHSFLHLPLMQPKNDDTALLNSLVPDTIPIPIRGSSPS